MRDLVRNTVRQFCCEFLRDPYLCYTEHGLHALFFAHLHAATPEGSRYGTWRGQRVSVIQKEYPTATTLGKPKRQHWDIAVLRQPLDSRAGSEPGYDFLHLEAVVEFGMNEALEHLVDDVQRVSHPESNVDYGFIVHLNRLSHANERFSRRDWSPATNRTTSVDTLARAIKNKPAEIWYAVADLTGSKETGVWRIPPEGTAQKIECT